MHTGTHGDAPRIMPPWPDQDGKTSLAGRASTWASDAGVGTRRAPANRAIGLAAARDATSTMTLRPANSSGDRYTQNTSYRSRPPSRIAATRPDGTRPSATNATTRPAPSTLFSSQCPVHSQAAWTQGTKARRVRGLVWGHRFRPGAGGGGGWFRLTYTDDDGDQKRGGGRPLAQGLPQPRQGQQDQPPRRREQCARM
jgi:hypothetical protein